MAGAARMAVWAARGNGTVDLRRLTGPLEGNFTPPPHLAAAAPSSRYVLGERADRVAVYELLLSHGTADDITRWVNLTELARCFDELRLEPHVAGPWRGALRESGLWGDGGSGVGAPDGAEGSERATVATLTVPQPAPSPAGPTASAVRSPARPSLPAA